MSTPVALACDDLDDEGAGLCRPTDERGRDLADEARVHVEGVLPGERCTASIVHRSPHREEAWATLVQLTSRSPDRVLPACAAYGACGGCTLEHWSYDAQLAWKHRHLSALVAGAPGLSPEAVGPPVASPHPLGYRNKGKWVVGSLARGAPVLLGAFRPRSHDLVDLRGCRVLEPAVEGAADVIRALLPSLDVEPYDELRGTGDLRHVVVRSNERGETLIVLVARTSSSPAAQALAAALLRQVPNLVGVVLNVNASRGNAIFAGEDHCLAGQPWLEDRLGEVRLRLSARAFFQANRAVAAAAYQRIADAAEMAPGEKVLDAYCGIGGIGLTLGRRGARVFGIEEHAGAVEDARLAARLNEVSDATFVAGDVAAHLRAGGDADVVVLNPPRKGCAPDVLRAAAEAKPRLIAYLSCRPSTLVRDLAVLAAHGYETRQLTALDMMPQTPQVEALALLRPRGAP